MFSGVRDRVERGRADRSIRTRVEQVEAHLPPQGEEQPVLIFNASTRINTLSLNAAFSLLTSWSLRAAGSPVQQLVCHAGMQQCMLGTRWSDLTQAPPCRSCRRFSNLLNGRGSSRSFTLDDKLVSRLAKQLNGLELPQLESWEFAGLELGQICLPTVRWALRRHRLADNETTRGLYRQYLVSAANLAQEFTQMLAESEPAAIVVFNGITYPEAVIRQIALSNGVPIVTHEVGLLPISAFFSHQHATFREVEAPEDSELPPDWKSKLDNYLTERRSGRFSMAGIHFWSGIEPLPDWLVEKIGRFRRLVPVFTNVIFDTSQVHADTLFTNMFDWLDVLAEAISNYPETLFVIRAHPDEDRPGKASQETVADWYADSDLGNLENVAFLAPGEQISSYELIDRASSVLVYNSSIGLEAAIAGKPVLCAGRARYSQAGAAYFPTDKETYKKTLSEMVTAAEPPLPEDSIMNGKRFLFEELFRESLDFSDFLSPHPSMPGMVLFKEFEPGLLREHPTLDVIRRGILEGEPFRIDQPVKVG